jgi:hypothetical protein
VRNWIFRTADADLVALSRLSDTIRVVRVGISEAPRRMRLSGRVWGERPRGRAVAPARKGQREPRVTRQGSQLRPSAKPTSKS